MAPQWLQTRIWACFATIERWLEAERDQIPVWMPVALGSGIAAWFVLPDANRWIAFIALAGATALIGCACGVSRRIGLMLLIGGILAGTGCALIWTRAEMVKAPILARPGMYSFIARIDAVTPLPAQERVRLLLTPQVRADLPPRIRINVENENMATGIGPGATVQIRAWLMPPPRAGVPGAYDFARVAWFQKIGATRKALEPVKLLSAPTHSSFSEWRSHLSAHVRTSVGGSAGALAATLATGDRGAIPDDDAQAMRRSGLAHLLSISGLHVTAVVGLTMVATLRLLALWPWLALRVRLPLVAAGVGALAAVGYTLMTGAQVPTLRSCIAALLVLAALATGREAITLRLIATGALLVMLVWPESLAGPSFQLSFAAVIAIVALHESDFSRRWFARREEKRVRRWLRATASLVATGLVVELALAPIAMFHFHKSGLFGALANIIAIPLTSFVIMPLEAVALLLDPVGLAAPFWWMTGRMLDLLLALAHFTSGLPGSVVSLTTMPTTAFALMIGGGLWLAIWRSHSRWIGIVPFLIGGIWAIFSKPPDVLVTGDGQHLAISDGRDGYALLRPRSGDYVRSMLAESAGFDDELGDLDNVRGAHCSQDSCLVDYSAGGKNWRILAIRSNYRLPYQPLIQACNSADLVVSVRRLPGNCRPRWLKLDRGSLRDSGGLSIWFAGPHVSRVTEMGDDHPWVDPPKTTPPERTFKRRRRFHQRREGYLRQ